MAITISEFSFDQNRLNVNPDTDFIAKIPSRLRGKKALLQALSQTLRFPAYFGNNWDALSDCLSDLSWIERRRVLILHEDLPLMDEKEIDAYLDLLSESVRGWKSSEVHELIVMFPKATRDTITSRIQVADSTP